MQRKKWFMIVPMILLLASNSLTACNSANPTGDQSSSSTKAKPMVIEIAQTASILLPEDDFVKKELEKKLNIELKMSVDQVDFESKLNVRIAGGNYPDVMIVGKNQFRDFAKSGTLLDLWPYLEKVKDYTNLVGTEYLKNGVAQGKQYGFPKAPGLPVGTYYIRKDWLDNLKLPVPTTVDELLAVAKAFTENDPDGNGKKDTSGLTAQGMGATFSQIFGAYGVSTAGNEILNDGKLTNSLYEPAMKDALLAAKKFIDAGVVDPEFLNNKGNVAKDKVFQGKFGITLDAWSGILREEETKVWKTANPKAEWVAMNPIKGPNGLQSAGVRDLGQLGAILVIPQVLSKQPEKLNKIMELINYVSSKEGNQLVGYGIKNVHFNLEGNKVVLTDKGRKENGYTWLYQLTGRPEKEYLNAKFPTLAAATEFEANMPRIQTIDGFIVPPDGFNKADADQFIFEELPKFIYGKTPIADYDKFLRTLEKNYNYQVYLDSAAKQAKDLGYVK